MNLRLLSERTGIAYRRLRYVADHELVPKADWEVMSMLAGRPRTFDDITGVFIVCAALMLDAGCRRDAVKNMMTIVARYQTPKRNRLGVPAVVSAIAHTRAVVVEVADGTHIRWQIRGTDDGWHDATGVGRPKLAPTFEPKVSVRIELGRISSLVLCEPTT